jgi:hypothetical protein
MSVWKDKRGRYHVAIQRGGTRVHRICPEQATWRDAKRKEAELEQRFQAVTTGKVLIADAIQHWLKTEVAHQKAAGELKGTLTLSLNGSKEEPWKSLPVAKEYKKPSGLGHEFDN